MYFSNTFSRVRLRDTGSFKFRPELYRVRSFLCTVVCLFVNGPRFPGRHEDLGTGYSSRGWKKNGSLGLYGGLPTWNVVSYSPSHRTSGFLTVPGVRRGRCGFSMVEDCVLDYRSGVSLWYHRLACHPDCPSGGSLFRASGLDRHDTELAFQGVVLVPSWEGTGPVLKSVLSSVVCFLFGGSPWFWFVSPTPNHKSIIVLDW